MADGSSASTKPSPTGSALADRVSAFNDWFMHRVPFGPATFSPRQAINLHKVSVGPLVLALMFAFDNWSLAAWMYLALHGTYGLMWVAKDIAFGDPSWRGNATLGSVIGVFIFPLGLYYLPALLILTPTGQAIPGGWATGDISIPLAGAAVIMFILGAFFHFIADAQKYFVLRHQRPRQLITDGMFALTRNPNYFGEILMYAAFNLLAQHWLPWAACALVWTQVFWVNMLRKEKSMSRYPQHAAWKKQTGFLVPSLGTLLRKLPLVVADPGD
jgi:steroid 5-alpha reductase family enzyme